MSLNAVLGLLQVEAHLLLMETEGRCVRKGTCGTTRLPSQHLPRLLFVASSETSPQRDLTEDTIICRPIVDHPGNMKFSATNSAAMKPDGQLSGTTKNMGVNERERTLTARTGGKIGPMMMHTLLRSNTAVMIALGL
jgi:hypothetical protein